MAIKKKKKKPEVVPFVFPNILHGYVIDSDKFRTPGFKHWTSWFETGNIISRALMLDYIAVIFIAYTLSHSNT